MKPWLLSTPLLLPLLTLVPACSDSPDGGTNGAAGASQDGSHGSGSEDENGSNGSDGPGLQVGNAGGARGDGGGADGWSGKGCAESDQKGKLSPAHLVFLLDQSGSMGDGKHGEPAVKWDPVTAALGSFFSDAGSAGLSASLTMFPTDKNDTDGPASSSYSAECSVAAYESPVVEPLGLPQATAFADAMAAVSPPNEWGTPTRPALEGTLAYAKTLLEDDPSRTVAVVMVTDGEPAQCNDNTVESTSKIAASHAGEIPTYVIGVGDSLDDLNAIAAAGGTQKATLVAIANPESTRQELLARINEIRTEQVSCEVAIPAPPEGKSLDPDKVNVEVAIGGDIEGLSLSEDCEGNEGWRYDDASNPSRIELCAKTCETVKAQAQPEVNVVFGCETRIAVK